MKERIDEFLTENVARKVAREVLVTFEKRRRCSPVLVDRCFVRDDVGNDSREEGFTLVVAELMAEEIEEGA